MSLDTLANVKARLGITTSADDTLLGLLQTSADKYVSDWCGRDFGGGTYTEYHPGGSEFLHLRNFPVQSVTSVNVDPGYVFAAGTLVSSTAYVVHLERGVIQSLVGPFAPDPERQGLINQSVARWTRGPRVVQVVYVVAAAAAPDDVLEAYAQLVGHWYRRVKTQAGANFQNVTQQKFGDAWTTYLPGAVAGLPLPPDVERLLAPYRVPNL
jgi:Phage gp6-like head-tail connector protein